MSKPNLTVASLIKEARAYASAVSRKNIAGLFGVTDGKAAGTYIEHNFRRRLESDYRFTTGNSAKGIDFPSLGVDLKVTSIRQPQSSCPFTSARQKIFGLGYSLLVFVYDKTDDNRNKSAHLRIVHVIYVQKECTSDYQTTLGLRQIVDNGGNQDDIVAFLRDRNLPVDEIEAEKIAQDVLKHPLKQGYLTISNALQWRLQYSRIIEQAGSVAGISRIA